MKIIFLDVDGVLNSEKLIEEKKCDIIDKGRVEILKNIIEKTGAKVVLSSGWRLWFNDELLPEDGYSQLLYDTLNLFDIKIFDKTPDFSTEEIRRRKTFSHVKGKEIIEWLKNHGEVKKYIVIDDLLLKEEEINRNLIRINAEIGLTVKDGRRAIEKLKEL
ncbi:HAD domain-containing protein [uncultured Clostridium sp.]|uniref:HAD domain-containing protein n=1 Tax=uncultured Clostridium sp. TaxID=59620 RepID=UPI0026058F33|nr:HAD domain-containing protein [uncultured Clostridium sp.]